MEKLAAAEAVHPGIDIDATGRRQLYKLNPVVRAYQFDTSNAIISSGRSIGNLPQRYIDEELHNIELRIVHRVR